MFLYNKGEDNMGKKRYEDLTFTDDFMFCKVLSSNEDICKELLELILGIRIRKIVILNKQQEISITADAKGIRLDVYVEDDDDSVYDIEMETTKKKNLPKRSRYYQGMIDLNIIERGERYETLKKSFVIFLCLNDPFGKGLHVYTFENKCNQSPDLLFGDETVKVFINAEGTADDISLEMAEFLRYLREGIGESSLVERIDQAVKKARDHVEWRTEYMSLQLKLYDIWDEARDEGLEAGREQGLLEGRLEGRLEGKMQQLFELVNDDLLSIEEAVRRTELTREDFLTKMKEYIRCE
jgi:predicted transposase/invertase (TIGR01784 family)